MWETRCSEAWCGVCLDPVLRSARRLQRFEGYFMGLAKASSSLSLSRTLTM
jgi:hypothetical protein